MAIRARCLSDEYESRNPVGRRYHGQWHVWWELVHGVIEAQQQDACVICGLSRPGSEPCTRTREQRPLSSEPAGRVSPAHPFTHAGSAGCMTRVWLRTKELQGQANREDWKGRGK